MTGKTGNELCGLCYTSAVTLQGSTASLPCGHHICFLCCALDIDISAKILVDNCHACKDNAAVFDKDLVKLKVAHTLKILPSWEIDLVKITTATQFNLLKFYNVMQQPEDEVHLAEQFYRQGGGALVMKCLKSVSKLMLKDAVDDTRSTMEPHRLLQVAQTQAVALTEKDGVAASCSDGQLLKFYRVLLDTVLNFTYTSEALCSELVTLGLLDILAENLAALEDVYSDNKEIAVVVLDALGIFFNCSRTDQASEWFRKPRSGHTYLLLAYIDLAKHELSLVLLALLSLCRALPAQHIASLKISPKVYEKISTTLDSAQLDKHLKHFHSYIFFSTTASNPEFDLQELLVPLERLARNNDSYAQWMVHRDMGSLLLFLKKGNPQEVKLVLEIMDLMSGPRFVDLLMKKPGLIDALFAVCNREQSDLKDRVWQIRGNIKQHYQALLYGTGHYRRTCYQQGHRSAECYLRNILSTVLTELKTCAEEDNKEKAHFMLEGFDHDIKRQLTSLGINGNTLLFMAARKGSLEMVKYLVQDCGADVEQRGIYEDPDSGSSHHAPPLWVAAVENQLSVVEYLVENGARVNSTSDTHSTPVRSACFDNNVDVVKYLVKHGANINQANIHGGTCLMNSVRCLELVEFLLQSNAEVNVQDRYGYTALQGAVLEKEPEVVKLLVENGADILIKSIHGDDAITSACLKGMNDIVTYFLEVTKPGLKREIETLELLGCFFVDDKNDGQKALELWKEAYWKRYRNGLEFPATCSSHPIFQGLTEITSCEGLENLEKNTDELCKQSLLIRQRILGHLHRDTSYYVMYRGAVYADHHDYEKSIDMWKYGLHLRHMKHKTSKSHIHDDCLFTLTSCSKLFWEMKEEGETPLLTFAAIFPIFDTACSEIRGVKEILKVRPIHSSAEKDIENITRLILHLMRLIAEIDMTPSENEQFLDLVGRLMASGITDLNNRTLLHLSVLPSTSVVDDEVHSSFPSEIVVETLLKGDVLVNWLDQFRNTPLHLLLNPGAENQNRLIPDLSEAQTERIVTMLVEAGAHLDIKNSLGQTVLSLVHEQKLNTRFSWGSHMTLKCLSARAINCYGIVYQNTIPQSLVPFVQLH